MTKVALEDLEAEREAELAAAREQGIEMAAQRCEARNDSIGEIIAEEIRALKSTPGPSIREKALREAMGAMCEGCRLEHETRFTPEGDAVHNDPSFGWQMCRASRIRLLLEKSQ